MITRTLTGVSLGVEYTFTVGISDRAASTSTPYAHEASALVHGRRFTRYGNTDELAIRAMMDAIREYVQTRWGAR